MRVLPPLIPNNRYSLNVYWFFCEVFPVNPDFISVPHNLSLNYWLSCDQKPSYFTYLCTLAAFAVI